MSIENRRRGQQPTEMPVSSNATVVDDITYDVEKATATRVSSLLKLSIDDFTLIFTNSLVDKFGEKIDAIAVEQRIAELIEQSDGQNSVDKNVETVQQSLKEWILTMYRDVGEDQLDILLSKQRSITSDFFRKKYQKPSINHTLITLAIAMIEKRREKALEAASKKARFFDAFRKNIQIIYRNTTNITDEEIIDFLNENRKTFKKYGVDNFNPNTVDEKIFRKFKAFIESRPYTLSPNKESPLDEINDAQKNIAREIRVYLGIVISKQNFLRLSTPRTQEVEALDIGRIWGFDNEEIKEILNGHYNDVDPTCSNSFNGLEIDFDETYMYLSNRQDLQAYEVPLVIILYILRDLFEGQEVLDSKYREQLERSVSDFNYALTEANSEEIQEIFTEFLEKLDHPAYKVDSSIVSQLQDLLTSLESPDSDLSKTGDGIERIVIKKVFNAAKKAFDSILQQSKIDPVKSRIEFIEDLDKIVEYIREPITDEDSFYRHRNGIASLSLFTVARTALGKYSEKVSKSATDELVRRFVTAPSKYKFVKDQNGSYFEIIDNTEESEINGARIYLAPPKTNASVIRKCIAEGSALTGAETFNVHMVVKDGARYEIAVPDSFFSRSEGMSDDEYESIMIARLLKVAEFLAEELGTEWDPDRFKLNIKSRLGASTNQVEGSNNRSTGKRIFCSMTHILRQLKYDSYRPRDTLVEGQIVPESISTNQNPDDVSLKKEREEYVEETTSLCINNLGYNINFTDYFEQLAVMAVSVRFFENVNDPEIEKKLLYIQEKLSGYSREQESEAGNYIKNIVDILVGKSSQTIQEHISYVTGHNRPGCIAERRLYDGLTRVLERTSQFLACSKELSSRLYAKKIDDAIMVLKESVYIK